MQYSVLGAILLAIPVIGIAAVQPVQAAKSDIETVRKATAKYKDVNKALGDGYVPAPSGCITAGMEGLPPEWGAMGIHYIHPGKLKLTGNTPRVDGMSVNTDFSQPSILLYEPQADGSMELVGIENLVFLKAWKEAGNSGPPSFAGQEWVKMADNPSSAADEAHAFAPHYDLHVWTERENPDGMFKPFNPNATCENFKR